jgi:MFS family permease
MAEIEGRVSEDTHGPLSKATAHLTIHPRRSFGFAVIARTMLGEYRGRSGLALALMVAQAFLFNAVFFSYGLVLTTFYHVPDQRTGVYLLLMAVSNFFGPLLLGQLFDTVGRRVMITLTYGIGGLLLIVAAIAFGFDLFSAWTQTFAWMVIFFFASAGASSAYLTASEIFPLETRALAIAVFYALGTAIGGILAPSLFSLLIAKQSTWWLAGGYVIAAALMLIAALIEALFGIDSEGRSLEEIANPLSGE